MTRCAICLHSHATWEPCAPLTDARRAELAAADPWLSSVSNVDSGRAWRMS